jgi:hypothetical protein
MPKPMPLARRQNRRSRIKRAAWFASAVLTGISSGLLLGKTVSDGIRHREPYAPTAIEETRRNGTGESRLQAGKAEKRPVRKNQFQRPRFMSLNKVYSKKRFSPEEQQEIIKKWHAFVQRKKRTIQPNILSNEKIDRLCRKMGEQYRVSPALLKAFIQQESNGDANAIGGVLEMGLVQIRPEKMADLAALEMGISNPFDPEQNVRAFCKLLYDYQRSAGQVVFREQRGGYNFYTTYQRVYRYQGKDYVFGRLPEEIQIQILSLIHNKGVDGTYGPASIGGSYYDVKKILYDSKGNAHAYALGILEKFEKNLR